MREGLMMYVDQMKCKKYSKKKYKNKYGYEVINFDMIHNHCRSTPLQNSETCYKTVKKENLKKFPKKEENDTLAAMGRCSRTDLYVPRDLMIEYYKTLSELF